MTTSIGVGRLDTLHIEIRHVPASRALEWLDRGWQDVKRIGWPGLAHGALIAALGGVLLALGSTHTYLTAAAVTGYILVGPIISVPFWAQWPCCGSFSRRSCWSRRCAPRFPALPLPCGAVRTCPPQPRSWATSCAVAYSP